jgi:hypothetical protein
MPRKAQVEEMPEQTNIAALATAADILPGVSTGAGGLPERDFDASTNLQTKTGGGSVMLTAKA